MNERGRNEADISRYTDVEYSPEGYKTVYRWGDFLEIAGGHVYNAMDTIDLVSAGGEYEGFNPRYAYTCEFVGCSTLIDGIALFRPVSRDGEDLTQIALDASLARRSVRSSPSYVKLAGINMGVGPADFRRGL